jgi:hypothetical protein
MGLGITAEETGVYAGAEYVEIFESKGSRRFVRVYG